MNIREKLFVLLGAGGMLLFVALVFWLTGKL
jgi:hypothetical protein